MGLDVNVPKTKYMTSQVGRSRVNLEADNVQFVQRIWASTAALSTTWSNHFGIE